MSEPGSSPDTAVRRHRNVALDYLKATIVLMVVAHHSCLAYTTFAHSPVKDVSSSMPTVPVVDIHRWWFFDYAENFNDVFFMSLMFFVSGLFIWPSLRRSGTLAFLRDRLVRLGGPFAVGAVLLMPLAYFASQQPAGRHVGYVVYWSQFISGAWLPGPLWFIWLLLFFDMLAAAFFIAWPRSINGLPVTWTKRKSLAAGVGMFVICGAAYLPELKAFGPHAWGVFFVPPLYFQLSRFGLYLIWFAIGAWLGHANLEDGLLAQDGTLARYWPWWIASCVVTYNALMFMPSGLEAARAVTTFQRGLISALLWIASCVASSFASLALFRGVVRKRRSWMDSLSRSAYVIYLVHYAYVLWLQRALLGLDLDAGPKFLIVFLGTAFLSWFSAQCLLRISLLRTVL